MTPEKDNCLYFTLSYLVTPLTGITKMTISLLEKVIVDLTTLIVNVDGKDDVSSCEN